MNVLVTGATGCVGQHTVAALLREGIQVRALGRDPTRSAALKTLGAEVIRTDLRDHAAVLAACAGCDAVLHLGALSAPWGKVADFLQVNVGGTASVIAGCRLHGVARLVYISSPSVIFTGRDHVLLTEDAPFPRRFASTYSWTKKVGEDLVREAQGDGIETVIIRPKAVFGPGDTSLLPRILASARAGRLPQIGDGTNMVDLTYVENVAHALLLALRSKNAIAGVYTITNDEHPQLWEVIRQVLARFGLNTDLRHVPLQVARVAAGLLELQAVWTKREPLLTRYTVAILGRTQTYDIRAAKRDLGYQPVVSLAEGVERTLVALEQEQIHRGPSILA